MPSVSKARSTQTRREISLRVSHHVHLSRMDRISLRTDADDWLPSDPLGLDPLGRVQGGDGIVEGRYIADVRPQSSVPHPLDDFTQLGAIGLDNEVDRQAVGGPRRGRPAF